MRSNTLNPFNINLESLYPYSVQIFLDSETTKGAKSTEHTDLSMLTFLKATDI